MGLVAQGVHRCALAAAAADAATTAAVPPSAGTYCARAASQSVSHRLHHHHRRRRIWSRAPPTFDRRLCPSSRCRRDCDKNPRILRVSQRVQTNTWRLCGATGGASNQRGPSGRPAVPRLQYSPSLIHPFVVVAKVTSIRAAAARDRLVSSFSKVSHSQSRLSE